MAKTTVTAPARKRAPINLTASSQATVSETAASLWASLYKPVEGDAEKTAAAYKRASDEVQKIFEAVRVLRDNSKPTQRERLDTNEVMTASVGKSMTDLQAAYIQLPIGVDSKKNPVYDRVNLPTLRKYVEMEAHPLHKAASAFMNEHKVRFIEREGKGRGKNVSVLEKMN